MAEFDEYGNAEVEASEGGGNFMTKKLGPLPAWGWVAVVVGGAVIYMKFFGGGGGASSGASSDNTYGETEVIASSGNGSDVLTALQSALSMDAAKIAKLTAANKRQNARIRWLEKHPKSAAKKK